MFPKSWNLQRPADCRTLSGRSGRGPFHDRVQEKPSERAIIQKRVDTFFFSSFSSFFFFLFFFFRLLLQPGTKRLLSDFGVFDASRYCFLLFQRLRDCPKGGDGAGVGSGRGEGRRDVMREQFLSIHPHRPLLPSRQAALGRGCDKIAVVWVGCRWVSWWNTS